MSSTTPCRDGRSRGDADLANNGPFGSRDPLAVFRIEDYVPDRLLPSYKVYKQAFVDLLVRTGIIYGSSRGGDRDGHDGTADSVELAKVRARHTKVTETIEERRSKLERERQALDKDWGRDWEWKKLEGTCVEQDSGE